MLGCNRRSHRGYGRREEEAEVGRFHVGAAAPRLAHRGTRAILRAGLHYLRFSQSRWIEAVRSLWKQPVLTFPDEPRRHSGPRRPPPRDRHRLGKDCVTPSAVGLRPGPQTPLPGSSEALAWEMVRVHLEAATRSGWTQSDPAGGSKGVWTAPAGSPPYLKVHYRSRRKDP
jgi:hypothetical protein